MYHESEQNTCVQSEPCAVVAERIDHILIIDDDHDQTEVLAHRFHQQGYRVSVAATCHEGRLVAANDHPDLILLDIVLPDGDGLDTCAGLRDGVDTADIPVILVSGADRPNVVRRARAAGCHYFVRKPYDPNALLVLSQNAISESRSW